MSVRSSQSITVDFVTSRFDTGAATNADSTPSGTLVVNGTDNAASVTVTNVSTGIYKAAVTLPTLAVGDVAQLRIAATVNSVAGVGMIWTDTKDVVIDSAGLVDANAVKVGPTGSGTAQTARDIGASVLLSTGTGTGQLDFTSGVVKSNLAQILGTALTETAGLLAAGFKKFFNIVSPTLTTGGIDQTGDSYARIGSAGAGLTALGDTRIANLDAAVSSRTKPADTQAAVTTATNLTNAPTAGDFTATMKTSLNSATPSVTVSDKTGFSLSASGIQAIWDALTSALTTVGSIGKYILDKIDVVLSTRLATSGYTAPDNTSIAAIKAKTDNLPASPASTTNITAASGVSLSALDSNPLESGTAQSGGSNSIRLRAGASSVDQFYTGQVIEIYGGTGAGQSRVINNYVGSNRTANVDTVWITNPDNTSTYRIKHRSVPTDSSGEVVASNIGSAWEASTIVHNTPGTFGSLLNNNLNAAVSSVAAAVWAVATRTLSAFGFTVSTNANATETEIKATTDKLTFTVPNQVDANTKSINDTTITGDGQPGSEFGV